MQEIIIYGFPVSTYVRSARLILEEKAVPYLKRLPDSAPLVSGHPQVARWVTAMEARPSMLATDPQSVVDTAA